MPKLLYFSVLLSLVFLLGVGCKEEKEVLDTQPLSEEYNVATENNASDIKWKELENGKYLPVPYYYQKDVAEYDSTCGPTSLKMVSEYKKKTGKIDKKILSISELVKTAGVETDVWSDSNVDNYFVIGFGITDVALKKLAQKIGFENTIVFGKTFYPNFPPSEAINPDHKGQIMDSKDFRAEIDEEGWDIDKLHSIIEGGNPVIVDVTVDMDSVYGPNDPRSYAPFYTKDDEKHWELMFGKGHFMVVVGFQNWGSENAKILLMDPLRKTENQDHLSVYTREEFEKSWELLNNQGLLIR